MAEIPEIDIKTKLRMVVHSNETVAYSTEEGFTGGWTALCAEALEEILRLEKLIPEPKKPNYQHSKDYHGPVTCKQSHGEFVRGEMYEGELHIHKSGTTKNFAWIVWDKYGVKPHDFSVVDFDIYFTKGEIREDIRDEWKRK
tara:strand:+ start:296 stop:721 length:426 start_codon:yes stop_codon:yes gene_type:complete